MNTSGEDLRAYKCGHNFPPKECPYLVCGYRDALSALDKCKEVLEEVRDALLRAQLRMTQK